MPDRHVHRTVLTPELMALFDTIAIGVFEEYLRAKWHVRLVTDEAYRDGLRPKSGDPRAPLLEWFKKAFGRKT